ncbi:uncharacterized protein [Prorops nasuta]|uniref:uncharacterized protein n=1 Tax=Prorops nasuta TaxID=863751 RepID=UPI0034CE39CC
MTRTILLLAAILRLGLGSYVAVRMPYLNPAGVTYVNTYQDQFTQYAADLQATQQNFGHFGYATAQVPAVAAVPYVKHVSTVSHVPVARIEAQHALLEKQLDVVKPALSTRKFQVRRPAIQKQFYDIEERVIVRPSGSALLELDEPTSKEQKGPAIVQPIGHLPVAEAPVAPLLSYQTPAPAADTLLLPSVTTTVETPTEEESVVVDNADFRSKNIEKHQQETKSQPPLGVLADSKSSSFVTIARLAARDSSPSVLPSQRKGNPEENKLNQQRLIDLLTARGSVAEVGFGQSGSLNAAVSDAGQVRGRVLSASQAPENVEAAGEQISTRRVVVSRPVETLEEIDVVEPATKLERISIKQPTVIKTAHLDHVQVHSSVPVIAGKALTPVIGHAHLPIYQKTISPAYHYYH